MLSRSQPHQPKTRVAAYRGDDLRLRLLIALAATALLLIFSGLARAQSTAYQQTNIVSDGSVTAQHMDPTLINPWGIAIGEQTPFWVNAAGSGVSAIFNANGSKQFAVSVPPNMGVAKAGRPTGIVFNSSPNSFILPGAGAATFVFVTLDGTISGWNASITNAMTVRDNSAAHAVYTGLALGQHGAEPLLLAANVAQGKVDVFDSKFAPTKLAGSFADPNLPTGYVPYGIHSIGNKVYITYVQVPAGGGPPVRGSGLGYVNVYDMGGNFVSRVASAGMLNAPWAVVLAPASFGTLGGDLLVGNFGDGTIQAFDPVSFAAKGQLQDSTGKAIANSGLWDLVFSQHGVGDPNALYFSAGINGEKGGVFGSISPAQAAAADFTVSAASSAISITAGQSGNMQINLAPSGGFNGAVTLSCSGLPGAVMCKFTPNPVMVSGANTSTMLTLTTAPRMGPGPYGMNLLHVPGGPSNHGPLWAAVFLPFGIGAALFKRRLLKRSGMLMLTFVLFSVVALTAVGCGYSKKTTTPQPSTFNVTVTATSGAITHSTQIVLTVN